MQEDKAPKTSQRLVLLLLCLTSGAAKGEPGSNWPPQFMLGLPLAPLPCFSSTDHRRSQEFVLGAQCWICQIFMGVGLRRLGVESGERCPSPHWGGVWGELENFLVFDLKMVNFGVFLCDKFKVFR